MHTCTKTFTDIPFAHRQHLHKGHCALIHGHNWSFEFTFAAKSLDENGFVVDFGKLGWLKEYINEVFDHKLVLNIDDPFLPFLQANLMDISINSSSSDTVDFAFIVAVPNCGAEGLALYLYNEVNTMISGIYDNGVFVTSVTVHEDSKNKATYSEAPFSDVE